MEPSGMSMLLSMVRDTRDSVNALSDKMDTKFEALATQRLDEARASGADKARLDALEERHKFTRWLAATSMVGVILSYLSHMWSK